MKTLCLSLLLAVLTSAPFEAAFAGTPVAPETTSLTTADHDAFGGGYKFKRKKRKKNRGGMRRKRHGLFGLGR